MIADMSTEQPGDGAPKVGSELVRVYLQGRFNPIAGLTPEKLAVMLDQFSRGYLRPLAQVMEAVEQRDDICSAVAPKRKKAPARYGKEVLTRDDSPEALLHQAALTFFYDNLTATSALLQNQRGGLGLLLRQMMDAQGKLYAVHDIVWEPRGEDLTATFWHAPLAFFESFGGKLRFIADPYGYNGVEMEDGGWLVSVGDGVMIPCVVAYMYKSIPLKDWLIYSRRHGMPGIEGVCDSAPGSAEWNAMRNLVASAASEMAWVRSSSQSVNKVDFGAEGELPYPALVERMDRAMSRLWRGADLSTMSSGKGEGKGASLQQNESDILEQDDADWLSETLQQVSRWVIEWKFGKGTRPLAYIQILSKPQNPDEAQDISTDTFLANAGVPLSQAYAYKKYGRPQPAKGDVLLNKIDPAAAAAVKAAETPAANVAPEDRNAAVIAKARWDIARAQAAALQPLRERIEQVRSINDDSEMMSALAQLRADFPAILKAISARPGAAPEWEKLATAMYFNSLAEAQLTHGVPAPKPADK